MLRFGTFELDPVTRRLREDGRPVALRDAAIAVLLALLERPGQVVTKRHLCEHGWPGLVDAENNLQVEVSALRKRLGPQAIVTISGRGYQFALPMAPDRSAAVGAPSGTGESPALFGRDAELGELAALLRPGRLVTLTGEAGIGKTRLAQALPGLDGTACGWVDMSSAADRVEAVWQAMATAAAEQDLRSGAPGEPSQRARALVPDAGDRGMVMDRLGGRAGLWVLDGCDGALQATASVVGELLEACPPVAVLVTSRELLRLPGEQVLRLGGLSTADDGGAANSALQLWQHEAGHARPTHASGPPAGLGDGAAAQALCEALDGHPLAITWAARWCAAHPEGAAAGARALLGRRREWPGLIADAASRHSLRTLADRGRGGLPDTDRALLRSLATLPTDFGLNDVHGSADSPWETIERLGRLVDRSLVQVVPGEPGDGGQAPRYRLSPVVRLGLEAG